MKRIVVIVVLLVYAKISISQDIHFSQFYNNPLNINPAATAFCQDKYRLFLNHRNQWTAVSVPYSTYSATADMQLIKRKYQNDIIGLGFLFNTDKAGDSEFETNKAGVAVSYIKSMGRGGNNVLSIGLNYTFNQRSINYTKLNFDNQFNGNIFIPSLGSGETFDVENFSYHDISAGAKWHYSFTKETYLDIGVAAWHLNRPQQSFMNDDDLRLPIRYNGNIAVSFETAFGKAIEPTVFYARQGKWQELIIGTIYKTFLTNNPNNKKAMSFGIFYRNKDAMFLYYALQYKIMTFAASYDFNISQLSTASNYRGGMEFTFIINYSKNKKRKIQEIKCPVF